jgi:hypothetical protein
MKSTFRRSLAAGLAFGAMPFAVAESPMKIIKATGPFDVKMTPASAADAAVGRFTLDKVTGQLAGRTGSFQLQHTGIKNRGAPSLGITVVPDSGTSELTGLTGKMDISVAADGAHYYTFEYSLPEKS